MKIKDLLEDVSVGTVSSVVAGDIATIPNPHVTNPYRSGKTKSPKPKKVKPTISSTATGSGQCAPVPRT